MAKEVWLTESEAKEILQYLGTGKQISDAARKFKRSRHTIMNLKKGTQKLLKLYEVETIKEPIERPKAVYSNRDWSCYG